MMNSDEYDRVLEEIRKKWAPLADARGPLFVPVEVRTVMLVSSIRGVIDNGGFEYLLEGTWEGDDDLAHAIEAFRRIGCSEQADVIAFVTAHFNLQNGSSSLEPEERIAAFKAAFPFEESRVELAGHFWSHGEEIEEKLTAFIVANKAKIEKQLALNVKDWIGRVERKRLTSGL
jgi:hypothetical protein